MFVNRTRMTLTLWPPNLDMLVPSLYTSKRIVFSTSESLCKRSYAILFYGEEYIRFPCLIFRNGMMDLTPPAAWRTLSINVFTSRKTPLEVSTPLTDMWLRILPFEFTDPASWFFTNFSYFWAQLKFSSTTLLPELSLSILTSCSYTSLKSTLPFPLFMEKFSDSCSKSGRESMSLEFNFSLQTTAWKTHNTSQKTSEHFERLPHTQRGCLPLLPQSVTALYAFQRGDPKKHHWSMKRSRYVTVPTHFDW